MVDVNESPLFRIEYYSEYWHTEWFSVLAGGTRHFSWPWWVLGICSFWYFEIILCPALGSWPTCWSVLISPPSLVSTHLAPSHPLLYSATFTVGLVQFLKQAWFFYAVLFLPPRMCFLSPASLGPTGIGLWAPMSPFLMQMRISNFLSNPVSHLQIILWFKITCLHVLLS